MIRTFNYTGRIRINRSDVQVVVERMPDDTRTFNIKLVLDSYGLPRDSKVYLEAYFKSSYMRFDLGTVGEPFGLTSEQRSLTQIASGDIVLFRIKVVDESDTIGKILAEADGVAPVQKDGMPVSKVPILPVDFEDLGSMVWRIIYDNERPVLQFNEKIPGIRDQAIMPGTFFALVYPSVIRDVLTRILFVEGPIDPNENVNDWKCQWQQFASKMGVAPAPDISEDSEDFASKQNAQLWIESVVQKFCESHILAEMLGNQLSEGDNE